MDLKAMISKLIGREKPQKTAGMTFPEDSPYILRHRLEYHLLPSLLFPAHLDSSEKIVQLWRNVYEKEQAAFPYQPDAFDLEMHTAGDGTQIARIELPPPETEGLCWRIYCLFNANDRLLVSFVLEKGKKPGRTPVTAIRADGQAFPLGTFPLYLPSAKNYSSMMEAETVMILNYVGKTL